MPWGGVGVAEVVSARVASLPRPRAALPQPGAAYARLYFRDKYGGRLARNDGFSRAVYLG